MTNKKPERVSAIEEALGPEFRSDAWRSKPLEAKIAWLLTKHRHARDPEDSVPDAATQVVGTLTSFLLTRSLAATGDRVWNGIWCDGLRLCHIEHDSDGSATVSGLAMMVPPAGAWRLAPMEADFAYDSERLTRGDLRLAMRASAFTSPDDYSIVTKADQKAMQAALERARESREEWPTRLSVCSAE